MTFYSGDNSKARIAQRGHSWPKVNKLLRVQTALGAEAGERV